MKKAQKKDGIKIFKPYSGLSQEPLDTTILELIVALSEATRGHSLIQIKNKLKTEGNTYEFAQ
jgi:hypothetical protein